MAAEDRSDDALVDWALARGGSTGRASGTSGDRPPRAAEYLRFRRLLEADCPAEDDPPRGDVNGRYTNLERIGRGGWGTVYRAWDTVLPRHVALKFPRAETAVGRGFRDRFYQEARILAGLRHPHVVTIHDFGTDAADGRAYLVLDWMSGGSLADRMGEFVGRPAKAARLMEQVARAIHQAHIQDACICHRDLKPANILLDEDGNARVTDFGLAKLLTAAGLGEGTPLPPAGRSVTDGLGTPPYMAPEQFRAGFGAVGPAADVWAVGVVLYELLTGHRPFDGPTREAVEEAVCTGPIVRPRQVDRRIPRDLEAICLKCLARRPEDRWPTAEAVADALRRARHPGSWVGRHRRALLAVAATVLVAASGAGFASSWYNPEAQHRRQVTAAQKQLVESGKLDLLTAGADGKAPARKRHGAEATDLRQDADGFSLDTTRAISLVEFLPAVPAERYTVRAIGRLRWSQNGKPVFGVVCRYAAFDTAEGLQNYAHGLFVANERTVLLEQRWYGPGPEVGFTFGRDRRSGLPPDRPADFRQVFPGPVKGGEWDLTIRVTPDTVTGTCTRSDGTTAPLGPITPGDTATFRREALDSYPDARPFEGRMAGGSGVGLLVGNSAWTVRRFEVKLDPVAE